MAFSQTEYARQWQRMNRAKCIAATRRWEAKNPEKVKQHRKRNYDKNIEKRRAYQRAWYLENKPRYNLITTERRKTHPERFIYYSAKTRAKRAGIEFSISMADIAVPTHCPVLGIPLVSGSKVIHGNSPSLDRINPSIGYVKGNVVVISHRANRIKNDATLQELRALVRFLETINPLQ